MTPKEKQAKAVEEMSARVGYDVPLCFATLNTIVINEETDMGEMPLTEYTKRKEGLERGFAELAKVVEKVEKGMRLQAQMKSKK